MTCPATLDRDEAAQGVWDVVVVGAGPAGALAAHQLATRGRRTLLVERHAFPRFKVCGGCLNPRALAVLEQCGLSDVPGRLGAVPVSGMDIFSADGPLHFELPGGTAVTRESFDAGLVAEAVQTGAAFLPETMAVVQPLRSDQFRHLTLRPRDSHDTRIEIAARLVLSADGSPRSSLSELPGGMRRTVPGSRVGAGAVVDAGPFEVARGRIAMLVGGSGYVGLTHVPGARIAMAADVVKLTEAKTVQGSQVSIKVTDGKVKVGTANVVKTDIVCGNGVIHVIDAVILPK
jgi:hypothetical protein